MRLGHIFLSQTRRTKYGSLLCTRLSTMACYDHLGLARRP